MRASFYAVVETEITLWEDAAVTDGSALPLYNAKRTSDQEASITTVTAPTVVTTEATAIWIGKTNTGKTNSGFSPAMGHEIILKPSMWYAFQVTKRNAADNYLDYEIYFYEETH